MTAHQKFPNSVHPPEKQTPPDALLLVSTHCPYCHAMRTVLGKLEKAGLVGAIEVINVEQQPDVAAGLGVRSVPWVRLGPFELEGSRPEGELREWAQKAGSEAGLAAYLDELLTTGKVVKATGLVRRDASAFNALLRLFSGADTQLNTRIGISAIMEDLEGSDMLGGAVDRLGELTRHKDAHIRGDACHYLALSRRPEALSYIRSLVNDRDADVRDIAEESLQSLEA